MISWSLYMYEYVWLCISISKSLALCRSLFLSTTNMHIFFYEYSMWTKTPTNQAGSRAQLNRMPTKTVLQDIYNEDCRLALHYHQIDTVTQTSLETSACSTVRNGGASGFSRTTIPKGPQKSCARYDKKPGKKHRDDITKGQWWLAAWSIIDIFSYDIRVGWIYPLWN